MKKGRKVQTSRLLETSLALATRKWIHDPVSQLRGTLPIWTRMSKRQESAFVGKLQAESIIELSIVAAGGR